MKTGLTQRRSKCHHVDGDSAEELPTSLQTGAGGMAHSKRFNPRTETTNSHSRTMNIGRRKKGRKTKPYNNIVTSTDG